MSIIEIQGSEQSLVDPTLADAGLPPAVGVQSYQIFRASKAIPEITDRKGWTYHHHVDMACWRGWLYVGWNSCERDEDVWPSRELYSTSIDGVHWTDPVELFPQGISTALRMYFFLAPNGRMLAIAGLRTSTDDIEENKKAGLVVREIRKDHTLGDVLLLQQSGSSTANLPEYQISTDEEFVNACRCVLANRIFLEQQDRGRLLGERRMKWHDASAWPGGQVPGDSEKWVCGKAFSFFTQPDSTRVGLCKMGYVTTSTDDGEHWSMPIIPPSLVTGKAKVWSQQTSDGRYALVYNPSRKNRYPLIIVTSDDGRHFCNMRIVQGELPVQRYPGKFRSIGPQYVRGISEWSNDGSRSDNVMWLVYSMSKEDIWVSRVPLPLKADERRERIEGFDDWNLYVPKWASAQINGGEMRLENRDPYDYVRAARVFRESKRVKVSFELESNGHLEIELLPKFGSARPVTIVNPGDGRIEIDADAERGVYSMWLDGEKTMTDCQFDQPVDALHRISFRTGAYRNVGGANPVPIDSDRPIEPQFARVRGFRLRV